MIKKKVIERMKTKIRLKKLNEIRY
jgi:hypothetical protein